MLGLIAVVQWFLLSQTPYIEDPGKTSDQGVRFLEYFATFVAIMVPVVYSFASAFEENPKPPDAIVVIILAIALFYFSFVVVFVYKMMMPDRYREAEVFYVSLSFVTKTSLHWVSEPFGGRYPSRLLTHARTHGPSSSLRGRRHETTECTPQRRRPSRTRESRRPTRTTWRWGCRWACQ